MNNPPAAHYRHFKRECPCFRRGVSERKAVLVRFAAANTGALLYSYRCLTCGRTLSDYLPHSKLEDSKWLDLDAWCPGHRDMADLSGRFSEIPGVVFAATVLAPAPGELPEDALVEAIEEQLHYFVDEAGDLNLFGRKGSVIVGNSGCSRAFIIGAAYLRNPAELNSELAALHKAVLADPALKHIESLKESRKRTALYFHAKDDHRLVRERVFEVLSRHPIKMLAVVRRKMSLVEEDRRRVKSGRPRFSDKTEYDSIIARLFKDRLHRAKLSTITIASRGASDRTSHLTAAVENARARFEKKWDVVNPHRVKVQVSQPHAFAGLQAADYYLWALQRVYERGDFEKFTAHQNAYRLIIDVDDRSARKTGAYFSAARPLTPTSIRPFET